MESSVPTKARARRWWPVVAVVALATVSMGCMRPGGGTPGPTSPPPTGPGDPDPGSGAGGTLPPVASTETDGPYAVTVDARAGANSTVFRPTNLGQNGVKHPIFVWGTGATTQPSAYNFHFRRMASHGFVIISPNSGSVSAAMLKSSLSWIIAQNSAPGSVYNGKLNTSKVAMGGHSLGSVATFNAEATLNNLTTTIHIAGGSFDGLGSSKVKTPTAYMCGQTDIALTNCQKDFGAVGRQPTYFTTLQGTDHIYAARNALPAMIAWLRWWLNGETARKADFSPGGRYFSGIFHSQVKNWN